VTEGGKTPVDDDRLIVFLKLPVNGKVKTRLAKTIGIEAATDLYRCFVSDTLASVRQTGYPPVVSVYPPDACVAIAEWLGDDMVYQPQEGGDLGERMSAAFREAFHSCSRAVLVGADCPDLPVDILREAFDHLKTHGAVVGPAKDGGYYLIGFSSSGIPGELFKGIEWGTSGVFEATMAVLRKYRIDVHILPLWNDIDEYHDLKAFYERQKDLPRGRLSTVDYLRDHLRW
jgi:uncharacterized protein